MKLLPVNSESIWNYGHRMDRQLNENLRAAQVLLIVVTLNALGAVILKEIASLKQTISWLTLAGFAVVILLNVLRLVVWRFAHKRFPLSTCYPITAMFFPLMFIISLAYNEPVNIQKVIGVLLIASGVGFLTWKRNKDKQPVVGSSTQ